MLEGLAKQFQKAGLRLEVLSKPIRGSSTGNGQNDQIFQMDIQRKIRGNARSEFFRIYPGNEDNQISVVSTDYDLKQIVLFVKEAERGFEEEVPLMTLRHQQKRHGDRWLEEMLKEHRLTKRDVVSASKTRVVIRRTTSSLKRHYLCGVDERQLFIAQLPRGVTTVRDAHASLKTASVTLAEGRVEGRTIRQGEWFFVNTTPEERRAINDGIRKKTLAKQTGAPIQRDARAFVGGKPHVADELVRLAGRQLEHGFSVHGTEVYVRGRVRHPDHATVKFGEWRRVIRNNEPGGGNFGGSGVFWID